MEPITEELLELHVDYDAGNILKDTVRWTRFISIMGFIGVGLLIAVMLLFVFAGDAILALYARFVPNLEGIEWIIIGAIFLIVLIFGFLVFMLARFSKLTRKAIATQDQELFNKGLNALRIYFMYSGILAMLGILSNLRSLIALF